MATKVGFSLFAIAAASVLLVQFYPSKSGPRVALAIPSAGHSVPVFAAGTELAVYSATPIPIPVAQHRDELERYYAIESQRAVEKLSGKSLPHGTYTVSSGTNCEVLSQRGNLVEVMWVDGPMIQASAWIHARYLREKP